MLAPGGRRSTDGLRLDAEISARNLHIVWLVASGRTNPEIAAALYLSQDTVKTHLQRIFRDTGARNRAHLATWFYATQVSPGTPQRRASDTAARMVASLDES